MVRKLFKEHLFWMAGGYGSLKKLYTSSLIHYVQPRWQYYFPYFKHELNIYFVPDIVRNLQLQLEADIPLIVLTEEIYTPGRKQVTFACCCLGLQVFF